MAKTQTHFEFTCPYPREELRRRLAVQVKLLREREYLIEWTDRGFDLGIGRGGHGAGYWYSAAVEDVPGGCIVRGDVEHRRWDGSMARVTWVDRLEGAVLFLILLPAILVVWVYRCFRPEVTMEDHFVAFMTGPMGCHTI